jgi:hypothetical protein
MLFVLVGTIGGGGGGGGRGEGTEGGRGAESDIKIDVYIPVKKAAPQRVLTFFRRLHNWVSHSCIAWEKIILVHFSNQVQIGLILTGERNTYVLQKIISC